MRKRTSWLFVDLIEDKIKNRGIFISVSLLFYVYITWRLIIGFPSINLTPASIESSLDMPRSMYMGVAVSEQRTPHIKITNINGEALSGINVTISLVKISTDSTNINTPICDYDYRSKIEGSLDYIRFHEICKPVLSGNTDVTDSKGNAYFRNFTIESGPEALYTFQYLVKVDSFKTVTSEEFSTYVISRVFELESLNGYSLRHRFELMEPLSPQPIVKITDKDGNPMVNKQVIAFSWVEPLFGEDYGNNFSPSNLKYLSLENIISEPSNKDGIAKFTNLTIVGTLELHAYIHFYCEGVMTVWSNRVSKKYSNAIQPPRSINPVSTELKSNIIEILNDIDRTADEGTKIDQIYTIRVKDYLTHEPIAGITCYAFLHKALNNTIPFGFHNSFKNHPEKYLKRTIPGKYSKECENPSTLEPILEEIHYTDQDGLLTFEDLQFSKTGPSGNYIYSIGFSCAGDKVYAKGNILVKTSIEENRMKFVQQYPTSILVSDVLKQEYDFILVIEVLDKFEMGVAGKYPTQISTKTKYQKDQDRIEIILADEVDLFEASRNDGIMTIPLKVIRLLNTIEAEITLTIDGKNITTTFIEFKLDKYFRDIISKIEFTEIPVKTFENGLIHNQIFEIKAVAYNLIGEKIDLNNYKFRGEINFKSNTQAQIPNRFVEYFCYTYFKENEINLVCAFSRAPTAHYYFEIRSELLQFDRNRSKM